MSYTLADWDQEYFAIFGSRRPPPHCPACDRVGFFGPRKANDDRRYVLCKFCGLYQEPNAEPIQCLATVHACQSWPVVAGAPYIWWVQPSETEYQCPYCRTRVLVVAATVKRPAEDTSHPWWQVSQDLTFDQAAAFWLKHGQARVYL
jgi:hypothetical protein